jgi:lipoprotein-releasing system permease protein
MRSGLRDSLQQIEGIEILTEVIEDYAYVRYRDANQVVTLKGVGSNFIEHHRLDNSIVQGELKLMEGKVPYAIIGQGVQYQLSVDLTDQTHAFQVYYIKNSTTHSIDPSKLYAQKSIMPRGVFSIVQNFDENYILVPLEFAKELLDYGNKRTSFEVKVKDGYDLYGVQKSLQAILGNSFSVLNPEEQHRDLYRLLKMEKLFTFLGLTLLLAIGSINIFFSLMMLAIDKKKDISILAALGADSKLVRKIFLFDGALISIIGAVSGLVLGGLFCWLHIRFGIISMGMASSITEGYPMKIVATDFWIILLVVTLITIAISARPAILAARSVSVQNL